MVVTTSFAVKHQTVGFTLAFKHLNIEHLTVESLKLKLLTVEPNLSKIQIRQHESLWWLLY